MIRFIFFGLAYLATNFLLPKSLKMMGNYGAVKKNYRGTVVPTPAGLIPVTIYLILVAFGIVIFNDSQGILVFVLSLILTGLGLLDDWRGDASYKGFKGHLKALGRGRLTTGAGKALGGGILAVIGAWVLAGTQLFLVNTLLIALSTNSFNLFDLRPGRAIKVFLGLIIILLWWQRNIDAYWLFALTGAIFAYLPWDLHSKGMLGDTGANILGFVLGLVVVNYLELLSKLFILFFFLGFNLYAEKYSLSQLIEKVPWLNYLDQLGRPEY